MDSDCSFSMCVDRVLCQLMNDIVDLSESSQCPSTQVPIDVNFGFGSEFLDNQTLASSTPTSTTRGGYARDGSNIARSSSVPSQSQAALPHKVRGSNWTEAKMFVLIGQKHIEWDGRHNSNQHSLAKFVYGTTAL